MTVEPIKFNNTKFIPIDEWIPNEEDLVFKHTKNVIILPVSNFYGINIPGLDYFMVSTKRCYNSEKVRIHTAHYLNYFNKFYDHDKELLMILYKMKYLLDFEPAYDVSAFKYDIRRYILSESILYKVDLMNRDNYKLNLKSKSNSYHLQYTNKHGMIMMKVSILMNILIPITCHFIYVKGIENSNRFFLEIFDILFSLYDNIDLYNKLYETSMYYVNKSKSIHSSLWDMQSIRGKDDITHSLVLIENIILNVMPKYVYNDNLINLNYSSIKLNTGYQITDVKYEFSFVPLSSSRRDEDNNSEFDKFESFLTKQDESLYVQNKVNCNSTMKRIELLFGPFDIGEINYYMDNVDTISGFQKELIFNLFYKYFGDPISIKAINKIDYIKLLISAKTLLHMNHMTILPYIISSKITKLVNRKNLNKKEYMKIVSSNIYQRIINRYRSEKIEKYIVSLIATILSSEFTILEYHDEELRDKTIETIPDIICEEVLLYINLI